MQIYFPIVLKSLIHYFIIFLKSHILVLRSFMLFNFLYHCHCYAYGSVNIEKPEFSIVELCLEPCALFIW